MKPNSARIYGARDPEGNAWGIGTYRPEKPPGCDIFPAFRYKDAPASIDWLTRALGFEKRLVVPNPDGTIAHAELGLGSGVVMLGSARRDAASSTPWDQVDFGIYACVDDIEGHHERAHAAGAEIVRPLADTDYGSREYSARDFEGNLWSFGQLRAGWIAAVAIVRRPRRSRLGRTED